MTAEQMEFLVAENELFDNLTVGDYNRREGMKLKFWVFLYDGDYFSSRYHELRSSRIVKMPSGLQAGMPAFPGHFRSRGLVKWYYSVGKTEPFSWFRRGA